MRCHRSAAAILCLVRSSILVLFMCILSHVVRILGLFLIVVFVASIVLGKNVAGIQVTLSGLIVGVRLLLIITDVLSVGLHLVD